MTGTNPPPEAGAVAPLALPPQVAQRGFTEAAAMAAALAAEVAGLLREGLARRGQAALVLSGGRSPAAFLRALADAALDWSQVGVTLADERWLPPEHADSNAGMLRATLLRGPAAAARFVSLYGGEAAPQQGLAQCARRLAALPRPFDAVVLGMGEDGHTASLFPAASGLAGLMADDAPPVGAVQPPPTAPHLRITLSLPMLLDARRVLVQIEGRRKREVIEQAAAAADVLTLPIAAVLQQRRTPVEVFFA